METTKERAARCDRATHARRSSSLPAYGSRTASITRRRRRAKRKALRAATLAAAVLLLGGISVAIFTTPAGSKQETNILPPTTTVGTYIPDTPAPAAETVEPTEPAVRYPLTDAERDVVERGHGRGRRGVLRGPDARRSVHPQRSREARRRPL